MDKLTKFSMIAVICKRTTCAGGRRERVEPISGNIIKRRFMARQVVGTSRGTTQVTGVEGIVAAVAQAVTTCGINLAGEWKFGHGR